ncbi:ATPase [Paraburkholderia sp. MMS20-SJTR3]|uniref:ATPase n=1 Tax=Paraburkholderia sejongensis TaxID=2886946 RepID=A0ABS8K595_9BURK|nr:ATPase [Paraburkholderia sp. MMS20-SJTR3]MCC8397316.1 ATPase [Paraburkholderia sp. MMS20-SJTR3]
MSTTTVEDTELESPVTADAQASAASAAAAGDVNSLAETSHADGEAGGHDGAEEGEREIESELTQMEADADRLQSEGVITPDDANMKRAEVEKTRKLFRDLPASERIAIIKRRRELGRQLMERQLSGAAVVPANVRLNHTRLKPLFEQWWPYLNRMSVNMQRFGDSTFGEGDKTAVNSFFEKQIKSIEEYVDEALRVATGFREKKEAELRAGGEFVFEPSIPMPAMELTVEVYSRFSMRVLSAIMKFDKVMDQFDFMVWNGIRDQSDVDDETVHFLKKVNPLGVRGYMTHLRLMTTVRGL